MSIRWMTNVFDAPVPLGADRLMLLALADNANDQGVCWPSLPTLARKCAVSRRAAISTLQRLEKSGFVTVERTGGKVNRYTLVRDALTREVHRTRDAGCTGEARNTFTGEAHGTPPVKRAAPKPSKNPQLNQQQQRVPDAQPLQLVATKHLEDDVDVDLAEGIFLAQPKSEVDEATEQLVRRGVSLMVAERLVAKCGPERVREVAERFDAEEGKGVGWLVKALEEGWTLSRRKTDRKPEPPRVEGPQTAEEADAWLDGLLAGGTE
ncbi:MAG: helix-turn-helix domain-containing protein [Bacteroidota bacterium]